MGISTSEGVVLAVEKRVTSTLMEPSSIEKVLEIDSHIGEYPPVGSHTADCLLLSPSVCKCSLPLGRDRHIMLEFLWEF